MSKETVHIVEYESERPRCGAKSKNVTHTYKLTTCRHCHGYCDCYPNPGWGCFRRMLIRRLSVLKTRIVHETHDANKTHAIIQKAVLKAFGREFRGLLFVLIALFLTGCGSSMVMSRGKVTSRYAPTNETRGGVVKFMVHSIAGQHHDRESAYKRMSEFCGGPYRITDESSNRAGTSSGVATQTPFGVVIGSNSGPEYWYIAFECEAK